MFSALNFFISGLFALNVALASIALGFAAIMVARLVRRDALALKHAFLCVALTLSLACPLAIQIASRYGFGVVPISLTTTHQWQGHRCPDETADPGIRRRTGVRKCGGTSRRSVLGFRKDQGQGWEVFHRSDNASAQRQVYVSRVRRGL